MGNSKRTYTEEFKKDSIRLALRAPSVKGAANDLGIPEGTLNTWLRSTTTKVEKNNNIEAIDLAEEMNYPAAGYGVSANVISGHYW